MDCLLNAATDPTFSVGDYDWGAHAELRGWIWANSRQQGHRFDSFTKGAAVEQAYAHILTHPGVPTVYWKHYFDWGPDLQAKIRLLINARKLAGVHAGSPVYPQNNATAQGVYAARIDGSRGRLFVRIGGSDASWQPGASGYGARQDVSCATWTIDLGD